MSKAATTMMSASCPATVQAELPPLQWRSDPAHLMNVRLLEAVSSAANVGKADALRVDQRVPIRRVLDLLMRDDWQLRVKGVASFFITSIFAPPVTSRIVP